MIARTQSNDAGALSVLTRLALAVAASISIDAVAADFAPSGTPGILTVRVSAQGGARHKGSGTAGLYAHEWKLDNTAQLTIRLRALDPVGDGSAENQAKVDAVRDASGVTDKDQAVLDKWEEKSSACDGNQACENRVMGQMMADPQYQQIISKMQSGKPAIVSAMRAVNVSPARQLWQSDSNDPSSASGTLQLDLQHNVYGVVDTAGGPPVDVTCRAKGKVEIAPGSPEAKTGAALSIDGKNSRYEIRIPVDGFYVRVPESCANSKEGAMSKGNDMSAVPLIGAEPPRGVKDFGELLTFKGPVGSVHSPQLSGKKTFTTELLRGNAGEPVPIKVTVEWHFSASGR
jgi:hypothetical protein